MTRLRTLSLVAATAAGLATGALCAAPASSTPASGSAALSPLAVRVPNTPGLRTTAADPTKACTLPDGSAYRVYHCYTPQQIRAAYGVDSVAPLSDGQPNQGQGQTIVLVDAYGSPTAAADLKVFHDTFFPSLPDPDFVQKFPLGNPQYDNTYSGNGQSGPSGAAGWSGEATLDIEWAYAIAPRAHIVLVATPPAETLGVQGLPNLFKAISGEIDAEPAGTLFSMSFGLAEGTFGGAAATQTARFDEVFKQGLAKHDNFFASSGDNGTADAAKQHRDTGSFDYPTVGWPASSPYVVSVGGTQLQYGWTWNPSSNDPYVTKADGSTDYNPAYWAWTDGGDTEAVWNESWAAIGTGGGVSRVYAKPSWQTAGPQGGRVVPDTSWNAAVNGGVDVYISAYPSYNCTPPQSACWSFYGGTSAASPQTAGLVALVNAARADAKKAPIGFLDPLLYAGIGSSPAYRDVAPLSEGTAPKTFSGTDVGVSGPVLKSAGDLVDNQMWQSTSAGYPTTAGYDATTGWGVPRAAAFVSELAAQ